MNRNHPQVEELFFHLFKNSSDGVFMADAKWRIYDADEIFLKTFFTGKSLATPIDLLALFEREEDFHEVKQLLQQKKSFKNVETRLINARGKRIYCELSMLKHKLGDTGEVVYLGLIYDISARKKAERDLLRAEKLVAAGKLSRILAHEVRNPLTNVQLALEQLKDEFEDKATEAALYFDVIERNAKRIGKLITELLNSSRPKVLNLTRQPVNQVLRESIQLVQDRLTLKNIELRQNLDIREPCARLDKEQLNLALVNIMVNAIEAMKEGKGVLTVTTKLKKQHVIINIIDNGHGLSETEIDLLFEPFYTNKRKGVGLGLTTTQNIIQAHFGTINVASIQGKKTQFAISLPAAM